MSLHFNCPWQVTLIALSLKCKLSKMIEPKVRFKKMNPGIRNSLEYRFRANEMIEPIDLSLKLNSLTISISKTVLLFHRF